MLTLALGRVIAPKRPGTLPRTMARKTPSFTGLSAANPKLIALLVAGAVNACSRWYKAGGEWTEAFLIDAVTLSVIDGLQRGASAKRVTHR